MFKEDELIKWCTEHELSDSALELISRIRNSEPSRQIGGGRKNVVGAYPSIKMGKCIHFESHKVELPGVYLKEHDDNVIEYYDQPPSIKISFKSLREKVVTIFHTPDYFVIYKDKAGWEEWKTEEQLCEIAKDSPNRYVLNNGVWRCPAGEEYAKQFGLCYWVKSSKDINWKLQRNIIFLEDYILDTKTEFSQEAIDKVLLCVRNNPGIKLIDILRTPGVQVDEIYYMLTREIIYIDLEKELLTTPECTHVFIDEESALAYKILSSNYNAPKFADHTLNVAPGVKVVWDGNPYVVANLGEKNISLLSDEGIINVAKDQFFNMVCQGQIQGTENEITKAVNSTINSILAGSSKEDIEIANYRYKIILPYLEGKKTKENCEPGVTSRTIRNWVSSYRKAEQQYGFGYIGLIPSIKKRGNRLSHLPDDTLKAIDDFLDKTETVTNQSNKVLYGKFCDSCKKCGIIAPSMNTFNKIIKLRPKYERYLKTQGSRVAYQNDKFYWELEMSTPRHGERPFEIAHIDHTLLDLELVHSETGKPMRKAWLTILMDAFSRRVLSFYLTFDAPSYRSDMTVLRECVRRFNRLPQTIIMDNGRDFKSTYFQSLLSYCGVTYKIRPAHRARFGSVGERLFGTTMTQLINNLQGNTKIMKNVRQVTKSVNPVNHAVWTLPDLYELLKEYFYEFYDMQEHSSLGQSPRETFTYGIKISGKRSYRFIPYDENFIMMTLPTVKKSSGTALVDPQRGVKINYRYFYCEDFFKENVAGTRVEVRYDPWDMGIVHCYVLGRWVKCYSEHYYVFKGRSENEIRIASQELLMQKRINACRANLSANELAKFILRAEASEELLKQRFCDAEMKTQLYVINNTNINSSNEIEMTYKPDFNLDNDDICFDLDDEINFELDDK